MILFKAKQAAQNEFDDALSKKRITAEQLQKNLNFTRPLQTSLHVVACTAANVVYGVHGLFNGHSLRRNKMKFKKYNN
ncbi:hypothetical protein ABNE08_21170 [Paenibacillus larvae]